MPPAPSRSTTSNGPRRVPVLRFVANSKAILKESSGLRNRLPRIVLHTRGGSHVHSSSQNDGMSIARAPAAGHRRTSVCVSWRHRHWRRPGIRSWNGTTSRGSSPSCPRFRPSSRPGRWRSSTWQSTTPSARITGEYEQYRPAAGSRPAAVAGSGGHRCRIPGAEGDLRRFRFPDRGATPHRSRRMASSPANPGLAVRSTRRPSASSRCDSTTAQRWRRFRICRRTPASSASGCRSARLPPPQALLPGMGEGDAVGAAERLAVPARARRPRSQPTLRERTTTRYADWRR